jgi:hypothetical protein
MLLILVDHWICKPLKLDQTKMSLETRQDPSTTPHPDPRLTFRKLFKGLYTIPS